MIKVSVYSAQLGRLHVGGGSSFCVWLTGERSLWPPSEAALGLVEAASVSLLANLPSAWQTATFCQPTPAFWSRLGLGGEQRGEVPSCAILPPGPQPASGCGPPGCCTQQGTSSPELWASACWPSRKPARRKFGQKKCRARELIFFFSSYRVVNTN